MAAPHSDANETSVRSSYSTQKSTHHRDFLLIPPRPPRTRTSENSFYYCALAGLRRPTRGCGICTEQAHLFVWRWFFSPPGFSKEIMSAPCLPRNLRLPSFMNCRTESQAQARKWQTPNHPHFSAPLCSFASHCSPTGSSVHGIFFFFQARILEWVLHFVLPENLPNPRMELASPVLQEDSSRWASSDLHLKRSSANHTDFRPERASRVVRSQWEEGIQRLGKFFAPDTRLSSSQYQGSGFLKTRVQKFCKE